MVVIPKLAAKGGGRISNDYQCTSCGYNLRGLTWGRACPECGAVARRVSGSMRDSLTAGGLVERQRWRVGLALAAVCIFVAMATRMGFLFHLASGIGAGMVAIYAYVGFVNCVAWIVAVWLATPRSLLDGRHWLRFPWLASRVLSLFWILGYACYVTRMTQVTSSFAVQFGDLLGRFLGGIGVMFFVFILCFLAGEAQLNRTERRLNAALWLLWFPTLLAQAFPSALDWSGITVLAFVLLGWSWIMTILLIAVIELQRHVRWADRHTVESVHRLARIDEKRREMDAEVAGTVRSVSGGRHEGTKARRHGGEARRHEGT